MKINIGAGKQTWDDFYCVDAVQHPRATRKLDLLFAFQFAEDGSLMQHLPLPDGCADEVHNYHFIEHVYQWEAPAVIREFKRLLVPGGKLVMELPSLDKCAQNLLKGKVDQLCMWGFYGDPGHKDPYMCHRWGYNAKTIRKLLVENGFDHIEHSSPQTHGARTNRDMRVEARKC